MHHYKKLAVRLFILSAMLVGILSMPKPASACSVCFSTCTLTCEQHCICSYQACVHAGALGCDLVLEQCSANCQL
jgi:hypothetical protein